MRALKAIAARLGLAAGGLLIGLLLAECGARAVAPSGGADLLFNSPDASPIGLYLADPKLLLTPAPGFTATARSVGYAVDLRINQLGLRGPEVEGARSTGGAGRWLTVGDSFTLSVQVSEEETFQERLAVATGQEFWNAGVDGFSTWQALTRYQRLDAPLGADGVLLSFFLGNDLHDNERFPHVIKGAQHLKAGAPIPREPVPWLRKALLGHSYLYAQWRVFSRQRALSAGRDPQREWWKDELMIFTTAGTKRLDQLTRGSEAPLRQLQQETRRRGDRLLVAIAPPAFQIEDHRLTATMEMVGLDPATADVDAPARAVTGLLQRLGIARCDLVAPLRAAADRGLYFTYDGHWTPEGHAVVAEALAACMESRR